MINETLLVKDESTSLSLEDFFLTLPLTFWIVLAVLRAIDLSKARC